MLLLDFLSLYDERRFLHYELVCGLGIFLYYLSSHNPKEQQRKQKRLTEYAIFVRNPDPAAFPPSEIVSVYSIYEGIYLNLDCFLTMM